MVVNLDLASRLENESSHDVRSGVIGSERLDWTCLPHPQMSSRVHISKHSDVLSAMDNAAIRLWANISPSKAEVFLSISSALHHPFLAQRKSVLIKYFWNTIWPFWTLNVLLDLSWYSCSKPVTLPSALTFWPQSSCVHLSKPNLWMGFDFLKKDCFILVIGVRSGLGRVSNSEWKDVCFR